MIELTGVGEETDLRSGKTVWYLVFNNGKLRVPVDRDTVRLVLESYRDLGAQASSAPLPPAAENVNGVRSMLRILNEILPASADEVYEDPTSLNGAEQF